MKKIITLIAVLSSLMSMAQAPNLLSYQAVVWDGSNNLVVSSSIGMQISILQGSVSGSAVYEETHSATSNANGLVSVEIGAGSVVSGDISTIDWSAGPYFLKTETDPLGGTTYTITGTTQLMSVPYALHAESATNISNDQVDDADADPANEIQDISLSGLDLSISSGSTVDLTAIQDGVDDADADPVNELNTGATLTTTTLNITDAGGTVSVDLASLQDGTTDADADPSNEIQTISQVGNTINLSNGGGSVTVSPSADDDPANEIQTLSLSNDTVYISDGNDVYIGPEDVIYPTLNAPFTNYGGAYRDMGYYKKDDRVYLQGLGANSNLGAVIFTLPVGYRPSHRIILTALAGNQIARIDIETNGAVYYWNGPSGQFFTLDGLSFRVSD
jgi:hypothetical protein